MDLIKSEINFTVHGAPLSKLAHRHGQINGLQMSWSPKENRLREGNIISQAMPYRPANRLMGPIQMNVTYWMPIPKSKPKWWKALANEMQMPHTSTPDRDNLDKMLADALKRAGFFGDDCQIFMCHSGKFYSEEPRTDIWIYECYTAEEISGR